MKGEVSPKPPREMKLAFIVFAVVVALRCDAQLVTFNFTGTSPGQNSPWSATSVLNSSLSINTGWSLGAGVTGSTGNNRFNASSWSTGTTFAEASTGNEYIYFSLTPSSGYELDLRSASLSFVLQNSATGPDFYSIRSSADSYGTDLSASSTALNSAGGTTTTSLTLPNSITLSALSGPLEFRIYGWGASGGTMSVNSWSMTGSVSAVPEPATTTAIAGGVVLVSAMWLRRKRRTQRSPA